MSTPTKSGTPTRYTASALPSDGSIVELVHDGSRTRFCVFAENQCRVEDQLRLEDQSVTPYPPDNNLLRHRVVLFPSEPGEFGSKEELIAAVRSFLHRYVDLTPVFEQIAAHYVLLSWIYDTFNDLPYLRVRGDFGSGKTRFLLTVGSICYKPMFASGASTASPLFRMIDAFQGTLVLDESDFRQSDERAEIVKILNNGNSRGFPVLRSEANAKREYDPRAYSVYGPKILATRSVFEDRALESRCITEDLGLRPLREDVPVTLPKTFELEATQLRNKLLSFRFAYRGQIRLPPSVATAGIEPRFLQTFAPLLSVVEGPQLRESLEELLRAMSTQLVADRGLGSEGQLLEVLHDLMAQPAPTPLYLRSIRAAFIKRFGNEYQWKISSRWIGNLLRNRLQLRTHKSHGTYLLPVTEYPKLRRQFERYGVERQADEAA